jgi:threonylcarbamoyladenosine tRNA methylthiotransferase MtaB
MNPINGASQRTVAIHTHGCKLNQADSDLLARSFAEAGYQVVDWTAGADVIVLNSCTVTAAADAKARQALRAARRANSNALVVATGCYAQRAASELSRLKEVSLVVGNTQKGQLVTFVSQALAERNPDRSPHLANTTQPADHRTLYDRPETAELPLAVGRNRAMIKIQEGCNQVCAYCIVPKVRGRERSIPVATLVEQVELHVSRGCKEVVLTGTQLGTYGFDLEGVNLLTLLESILAETKVDRIRVSSLQPQEINRELLEAWENPRLAPHFHVPLQSGCDRILKSMRRRYDVTQFARAVELIRQRVPNVGITTDLIVGFPGEGEAEYHQSRRFVRSVEFSDMHIFPYSPRPGTSAAYLKDQVPAPVKKTRTTEMAEVALQGFRAFRQQQLGSTRPVLWESARGSGADLIWTGLTDNYLRVTTEDRRTLRNLVTPAQLRDLTGDRITCSVL